MICKSYIEKAYEHVSWDTVVYLMEQMTLTIYGDGQFIYVFLCLVFSTSQWLFNMFY